MLRRWAIVAAALIAIGGFEPFYFDFPRFVAHRASTSAYLTDLPYQKTPGLRTFYAGIRARTKPGDTIAIAAPFPTWDGGYEYVYARSLYTLAGRRIYNLIDPNDRGHPENLRHAMYIAAYRSEPHVPGFATVWRSPDGTLLRRIP